MAFGKIDLNDSLILPFFVLGNGVHADPRRPHHLPTIAGVVALVIQSAGFYSISYLGEHVMQFNTHARSWYRSRSVRASWTRSTISVGVSRSKSISED